MFIGEYQHTMDAKGRLFMPAKYRDSMGDKFIITKGLEKCLFAYPESEWNVMESKLRNLPLTQYESRAFVRLFFSGASECEPDKQGRFLIPANLRQYCTLEKDAVVIGVGSRIEIWSKDLWENYTCEVEPQYAEIARQINLDGF